MERVLTQKINYFADNLNYEITIVTTEQMQRPCFYKLSENIKLIDIGLNFNADSGAGLLKRTFLHYYKLQKYKKIAEDKIKAIKPDICVSLGGKEIEFFAKLKSEVPKIVEIHFSLNYRKQFLTSNYKGKIWSVIGDIRTLQLKRSTKQLDKLVVLTHQDEIQWKKTHKNIVRIPNPNPLNPFYRSTVQNKTVISVGRLDAQKGFDMLIDAWKVVAEKHSDWVLNIFGQGEWEEMLRNKINLNNLHNQVILKGLSHVIENEYLNSSIYVMSSRYEGFGMVILEAMSCGLPVVSFDCQWGPSELIKDGENGFLVSPNDTQELADKICLLIEKQKLRLTMSINAVELSKKYDISNIIGQWTNLFNEVTKK